ncbi:ABC transporter permease subunit [Pimelobacter simplex]|uniref:Putative ABC transporter, permease n=1 Tax=Nocardioides simplex TaxID=2045 RepID=A0A0A1DUC1_NOCSI|nr:ABC transporter permease [Pimelobacter simplex]AIY20178.2 putative ABC transporter, permease [Pimelobacter simplex]MCG8149348.1 ABC transporter permease subunit [Pimelobacter simplex]GEB16524.1 ABC transporter permease [Pimelobacter simplex]SFM20267.1 peptide/nickel transport system permease protein [Pimelobacter simplex]
MSIETTAGTEAPAPLAFRAARRRRRRLPSIAVLLSIAYLACIVVAGVFGPLLVPHANVQSLTDGLQGMSSQHWLGTDDLGRDIFERVVLGARTALYGPLLIALGAFVIGCVLGLTAGYVGGIPGGIIMRWVDLMYALPGVLVAIVAIGVLGGGYWVAVAVIMILSAPYDTRLVRAVTIEQKGRPYVEAARTLGMSRSRVMFRHLLPNVLPLAVSQAFLSFAFALINLSALSFLGLGSTPGSADWGTMLAESQASLLDNPLIAIGPALAIIFAAVSVNVLGDYVFDRLSTKEGRND